MVAAGMWQYGNVGVAQFILVPCLMLLMMHKPHHSRLTAFRAPSVLRRQHAMANAFTLLVSSNNFRPRLGGPSEG